jgi:hypothetical protein
MVAVMNAEDDPHDTIVPRFINAGGVRNNLIIIEGIKQSEQSNGDAAPVNLADDLSCLEELLQNVPELVLIIIDPISAYLGNIGENQNAEVRKLLSPFVQLASKYDVAFLCVTHLRKKRGKDIYRFIGSVGFVAASRSAWLITKHPQNERQRLFRPVKSNIAHVGKSLCFEIASLPEGGENAVGVWWSETPQTTTLNDPQITAELAVGRPDTQRAKAVAILNEELAQGPALLADILKRAHDEGINERSLRRVRTDLGIVTSSQDGKTFCHWPSQTFRKVE